MSRQTTSLPKVDMDHNSETGRRGRVISGVAKKTVIRQI